MVHHMQNLDSVREFNTNLCILKQCLNKLPTSSFFLFIFSLAYNVKFPLFR